MKYLWLCLFLVSCQIPSDPIDKPLNDIVMITPSFIKDIKRLEFNSATMEYRYISADGKMGHGLLPKWIDLIPIDEVLIVEKENRFRKSAVRITFYELNAIIVLNNKNDKQFTFYENKKFKVD